jgi:hypothetical protein
MIRGADFQTRGLRIALKVGERRRVARALALEAIYVGATARKRIPRAQELVAQAMRLAERERDPYLIALCTGVSGILLHFDGQGPAAIELLAHAEGLFDKGTGSFAEINNARVIRLFVMESLGRYEALHRQVDEYTRDAVRRGDRFTEAMLIRAFNSMWLAADDPARAIDELDRHPWTGSEHGYHVQHMDELRARIEHGLYVGALSWDQFRPGLAEAGGSLLMHAQIIRIVYFFMRARVLLAIGHRGGEVQRLADRLRKETLSYGVVWARMLDAGLLARRDDRNRALAALADAVTLAEQHQMFQCAAAARHRHGQLLGGDPGRALSAQAIAWYSAEGVRNPERFTRMLLPGFDPPY